MPLQRCDHARREQSSVSMISIWQYYQGQESLSDISFDTECGRDIFCGLPERANVWAFLVRQQYAGLARQFLLGRRGRTPAA